MSFLRLESQTSGPETRFLAWKPDCRPDFWPGLASVVGGVPRSPIYIVDGMTAGIRVVNHES
jgi:hypothetical protein